MTNAINGTAGGNGNDRSANDVESIIAGLLEGGAS